MYSARVTHVNTQCANRAVSWEFDGTRIRFLELGDFLITVGGPQGVWKSFFSGREPHGIVPCTFASIQRCRLPSRFPGSSQQVEFGLRGGGVKHKVN